jgi:hypothetical protein
MPLFTYVATTDAGMPAQGQIEADSTDAALSALRDMGFEVQELHEATLSEQQAVPPPPPPTPPTLSAAPAAERIYFPVLDTLRIYAGWLLALIGAVYALGGYQSTRPLPFEIPLVSALLLSPLLLQVVFASFIFLLFSSLHRALRGGPAIGLLLAGAGILLFSLYRTNILSA